LEAGIIETVTSKLTSKRVQTGSNGVKRGHSIPYHHQQGVPHPLTPRGTPFDPFWPLFLMLNSMLPLSILKSCRCYRFDDIIFEVDLPVFDISYFSPIFLITTQSQFVRDEVKSEIESENEFSRACNRCFRKPFSN
jgi:hypothetical protein